MKSLVRQGIYEMIRFRLEGAYLEMNSTALAGPAGAPAEEHIQIAAQLLNLLMVEDGCSTVVPRLAWRNTKENCMDDPFSIRDGDDHGKA